LLMFRVVSTSITSNTNWQQVKAVKAYFTLLYKQKQHNLSKADLLLGKIMVLVMFFARKIVYKFI